MDKRKILVVEDDSLLRSLISDVLTGAGFIVTAAANAVEAKNSISSFDPDVALLDIELGAGPSGIDLAEFIKSQAPHVAIIFLTHLPDPRFAGVDSGSIPKKSAYIRKEMISQPGLLLEIVESVLRDETGRGMRHDLDPQRPFAALSKSQVAVLRSVALGLSNSEIAAQRNTTVRAVENLIRRTLSAAGIENEATVNIRTAAVRAYIEAAGLPVSNE